MKPWEVYQWEFPHGAHPAVILSPYDRCVNPDIETVNVIGCSSKRTNRLPEEHEVMLNGADGMEWETLARCDVMYLAKKSELVRKRGAVTHERRRMIGEKIIKLFGLRLA
jgi:hypothetical protein